MKPNWWTGVRPVVTTLSIVCMLGIGAAAEQDSAAQAKLGASARAKGFTIQDARALIRMAAAMNTGQGHGVSRRAAEPPIGTQSCCSMWQGFDFTGTLSVAPTNSSGGIACVNCAAGLA